MTSLSMWRLVFFSLILAFLFVGCGGDDDDDDDSGSTDDDVSDDDSNDDDVSDDDTGDTRVPTTLDLTLIPEPDSGSPYGYALVEGPGEEHQERNDLMPVATRDPGDKDRLSMAYYLILSDFQLTDEESPTRLTFFDSNILLGGLFQAAYRPQEDVSPQLVNAMIRTANGIQVSYDRDFDFAITLGDLTDNDQLNEMETVLDVFDANGLLSGMPGWVRPDSGDLDIDTETGLNRGQRDFGVQQTDGDGHPLSAFERPGLPNSNADFPSDGLLRSDGSPLPWVAALGNHDVLNTGNFDPDSGLTFFKREDYLSGHSAFGYIPGLGSTVEWVSQNPGTDLLLSTGIFGIDLNWQTLYALLNGIGMIPDDYSDDIDPRFDLDVLSAGTYGDPADDGVDVTPDPNREFLGRDGAIQLLSGEGHGFVDHNGDDVIDEADGGWYSFDVQELAPGDAMPLRFIVLDTTDAGVLSEGGISPAQFAWLQDELDRAVEDGVLVIVNSHHPSESTPNGGDHLVELLNTCPNVIMHQVGHGHRNAIIPHPAPNHDPLYGYWEVQTPSSIDFPQQGRVMEIVDNRDGTGLIINTLFDHWSLVGDDSDTLGDLARDLAFDDAARKGLTGPGAVGGMGGPEDRNRMLRFQIPDDVADKLAAIESDSPITSLDTMGH